MPEGRLEKLAMQVKAVLTRLPGAFPPTTSRDETRLHQLPTLVRLCLNR